MATALWEPDTLLASQYAAMRESRQRSGETCLALAVLKCAFNDYLDALRPRVPCRELVELTEWFFDGDDSWPFSFENLCAQLDLNPERIRADLAALAGKRAAPGVGRAERERFPPA
jgi:hypothetical protein